MKTFNCTQCGASIERIPVNVRVTRCEYCKAQFVMPERNSPGSSGLSFGVLTASDPDSDGPEFSTLGLSVFFGVLLVVIVFTGVKVQGELLERANEKSEQGAKSARVRKEEEVTNVPVAVEWEGGPQEVRRYDVPVVNWTSFALARRSENSPGGKHVVVIRVMIDPDGTVSKAETVSGNPVLDFFAIKSARTTVFIAAKNKRTRTITYVFG